MTWPGRIGPMDEVTLTEAADLLGLSPGRINTLVESGEIPARTNFSVTHISLGDIEVYRRRREAGAI
jgi:hypothetical protein